jgi:uncharacterized protein HemX
MKKITRALALIASCTGMGMAMPSCPGQQAMQQQIDTVQASNVELAKKVQAQNAQITTLHNDMVQVKQLLPQMSNVIQAQKGSIDQLDASVKELKLKTAVKIPPKRRH